MLKRRKNMSNTSPHDTGESGRRVSTRVRVPSKKYRDQGLFTETELSAAQQALTKDVRTRNRKANVPKTPDPSSGRRDKAAYKSHQSTEMAHIAGKKRKLTQATGAENRDEDCDDLIAKATIAEARDDPSPIGHKASKKVGDRHGIRPDGDECTSSGPLAGDLWTNILTKSFSCCRCRMVLTCHKDIDDHCRIECPDNKSDSIDDTTGMDTSSQCDVASSVGETVFATGTNDTDDIVGSDNVVSVMAKMICTGAEKVTKESSGILGRAVAQSKITRYDVQPSGSVPLTVTSFDVEPIQAASIAPSASNTQGPNAELECVESLLRFSKSNNSIETPQNATDKQSGAIDGSALKKSATKVYDCKAFVCACREMFSSITAFLKHTESCEEGQLVKVKADKVDTTEKQSSQLVENVESSSTVTTLTTSEHRITAEQSQQHASKRFDALGDIKNRNDSTVLHTIEEAFGKKPMEIEERSQTKEVNQNTTEKAPKTIYFCGYCGRSYLTELLVKVHQKYCTSATSKKTDKTTDQDSKVVVNVVANVVAGGAAEKITTVITADNDDGPAVNDHNDDGDDGPFPEDDDGGPTDVVGDENENQATATADGTHRRCSPCNIGFSNDKAWKRHQLKHTNEQQQSVVDTTPRNFICNVCQKDYKDYAGLRVHEKRSGHEDPKFVRKLFGVECPHCKKLYANPRGLEKHIRVYCTGLKYCPVCLEPKSSMQKRITFTNHIGKHVKCYLNNVTDEKLSEMSTPRSFKLVDLDRLEDIRDALANIDVDQEKLVKGLAEQLIQLQPGDDGVHTIDWEKLMMFLADDTTEPAEANAEISAETEGQDEEAGLVKELEAIAKQVSETSNKYQCEICLKFFTKERTLKFHQLMKCSAYCERKCPICNTELKSVVKFYSHVAQHIIRCLQHKGDGYTDMILLNVTGQNLRERLEEEQMKLKEPLVRSIYRQIMEVVAENVPVPDPPCFIVDPHRSFVHSFREGRPSGARSQSGKYKRVEWKQQMSHLSDGRIQCNVCSVNFGDEDQYKRHYLSEHAKNFYLCEFCAKPFPNERAVNLHRKVHFITEKQFKCDMCNTHFRHKSSLLQHRREHLGLTNCMCDICGKTFKRPYNLRKHMEATHLDIKPFHCKICPARFGKKWHLEKHTEVHTSGRRHQRVKQTADIIYPCEYCSKVFLTVAGQKAHMQYHMGVGVPCQRCSRIFTAQSSMERHMLKIHGEVAEPPQQTANPRRGRRRKPRKSPVKQEPPDAEQVVVDMIQDNVVHVENLNEDIEAEEVNMDELVVVDGDEFFEIQFVS